MSLISRTKQAFHGIRGIRQVHRAGGPKRVTVLEVGRPEGLIFATAKVKMEVETKDGSRVPIDLMLPVPFPWAWGYRALRKAGVPVISQIDPEDLRFGVGVPDWAWPGGGGKPPADQSSAGTPQEDGKVPSGIEPG